MKYLSSVGAVELNSVRPAFTAAYTVAGKMQTILEACQTAIENNAANANMEGGL